VDPIVETFLRGAMNAAGVAALAAVDVVAAGALVLGERELLLLLEPPHPARATVAIGIARISFCACGAPHRRRALARSELRGKPRCSAAAEALAGSGKRRSAPRMVEASSTGLVG
jgi:hypothetical protein